MSDFSSDLKNTSFVKSPANAVVDVYEQYVHDLDNRERPLISRLTKKDSTDWMFDDYRCAKSKAPIQENLAKGQKFTEQKSALSSDCSVQCTCKQG